MLQRVHRLGEVLGLGQVLLVLGLAHLRLSTLVTLQGRNLALVSRDGRGELADLGLGLLDGRRQLLDVGLRRLDLEAELHLLIVDPLLVCGEGHLLLGEHLLALSLHLGEHLDDLLYWRHRPRKPQQRRCEGELHCAHRGAAEARRHTQRGIGFSTRDGWSSRTAPS